MFEQHDIPLEDEIAQTTRGRLLDIYGREKPTKAHPERDLQRTVVRWLRTVLPGSVVWATPNEQRGYGHTKEQRARFGAARKASGVLTGAPDLTIVWRQRVLFVELKAPGGTVSDSQWELHDRLSGQGYRPLIANSIETLRWALHEAGVQTIEAAGQPAYPMRVSKRRC